MKYHCLVVYANAPLKDTRSDIAEIHRSPGLPSGIATDVRPNGQRNFDGSERYLLRWRLLPHSRKAPRRAKRQCGKE